MVERGTNIDIMERHKSEGQGGGGGGRGGGEANPE